MGLFGYTLVKESDRQTDIEKVKEWISGIAQPENTLQSLKTPAKIDEAFGKVDILQSIEITCKDLSKNNKLYLKDTDKEFIITGYVNTRRQTFNDLYAEIIREKVKYGVAVCRKYSVVSNSVYIECLQLKKCTFDFSGVQYPKITDLRYCEYENERIEPQNLLFFGCANNIVNNQYDKTGIELAVSNLINDYEAKHNIIAGRGAMGIISPAANSGDKMDPITLSESEKKEIERGFTKEYGLIRSKLQWIISKTPLSVTPTSMNVQELGIAEDKKENITAICAHMKYPTDLYFNGTTFENQKTARQAVYNNILTPFANEDSVVFSEYFKTQIVIDYSHVPELQVNEKERTDKNAAVVNYCIAAVTAGIMTIEQAKQEIQNSSDIKL